MSINGKPLVARANFLLTSTIGLTLAPNTYDTFIFSGGAGGVTVPLSTSCASGQSIKIKNLGTGVLAVNASVGDNLCNNAANFALGNVTTFNVAIDAGITLIADPANTQWLASN
jgi:hypothetical protein